MCPTPIQVERLRRYLSYHPDQTFAAFICTSLYNDFHVGFDRLSIHLHSASHKHPSSVANPAVVETHIAKEVAAGRLVGPIANAISLQAHVSPIGLVPKSHQVNKFRMIVDPSFPAGHSVNDGIFPELCSLSYASVEHI